MGFEAIPEGIPEEAKKKLREDKTRLYHHIRQKKRTALGGRISWKGNKRMNNRLKQLLED